MKKIFLILPLWLSLSVQAQPTKPPAEEPPKSLDHFNQEALRAIQDNQIGNPDEIPQVFYDYYVVKEDSRLRARLNLYEYMGINKGDTQSREGQVLIQLINRNLLEELHPGDTLVVPTQLGLDLRAYSPFPRYYQAAKEHKKIIILDKEIQAFAAYEDGVLRRWGIINTGTDASQTPEGRFNVNWKAENRISSLSPGVLKPKESDEMWDMTWVMNIHEKRGIHMHQYAMPTGGPASHGCVRMNDADAEWLFNWVDVWETSKPNAEECTGSKDCKITKQGTMVLVLGPDPKGKAQPFVYKNRYPILKIIDLPTDPYSIPAGTDQQKFFDRIRLGKGTTANRGVASPMPRTTQAKPRTTATKPKNNQAKRR
ncbi:MAG TPA: L,D-transpeptidase [Rhodothermales bacterium]|nr:L,D-transpeptidase [Bacteroidota bacterium]HRK74002.1 L,D-transpeptidase [Rhodothermales bacterium]HRR09755.1 L,D-transpeptidase [Rhodothermales bacterium]